MLSTKFVPASTDGQDMSHGWKTTGGTNTQHNGANETTSSLGVIQKTLAGWPQQGLGPNWSHVAKNGVKQNPDDDDDSIIT